ncbi:MAG: GTPase ObgE [Candidatus Kaiserbacteria bacterium]|nr:GTPase ObgE [Candidatus Kaiserbacteria bacterium]
MLVDERTLTLSGGRGGDGSVHWLRRKYVPKGGPDGGNGGRGGDVYVQTVRDIFALGRYAERKVMQAENGTDGSGNLQSGKNGSDLVVSVPIGSIVTNTVTRETFELLEEGEKVLVASGGAGGLGNAHFKSSRNTTPMTATSGQEPQSYTFFIELNMIAEAGIIGLPNAGKSSFLNALTNARAGVGAYPFTTLDPNLGVYNGYTLADIPGIIEHASEGKGLGHSFLKHISRTKVLVHLVSAEEDVAGAYQTVRGELSAYRRDLGKKEEMVVLSKTDTVSESAVQEKLRALPPGTLTLTVLDDDSVMKVGKEIIRRVSGSKRR